MVDIYTIRPGSYATVAEAKEGGSGGVTKEYVDTEVAKKQNVLTAGANITITGDVISATGELASTEWGEIGGLLSDQTDLATALDGKADDADVTALDTRVGAAETAITGLDGSKASKTELSTAISGVEAQIPDVSGLATKTEVTAGLNTKQDTLVSASNIKTINGTSVLGSGDIAIEGVPDTTGASSGDVLTFDGTDVGWAAGGGSAPTNMVTTDTDQTITGQKTITSVEKPVVILAGTRRYVAGRFTTIQSGTNDDTGQRAACFEMAGKSTYGGQTFYINPSITMGAAAGSNYSYDQRIEISTGSGSIQDPYVGSVLELNGAFGPLSASGLNYKSGLVWRVSTNATNVSLMEDMWKPAGSASNVDRKSLVATQKWVQNRSKESTITGDGTTTQFTVTHDFAKMPSIVQVTVASTGKVLGESEVTITKTTQNVVVDFATAPASGDVFVVAMLY